jgi:hypothetical protein
MVRVRRRILILGYSSGLQIWDCADLGSVKEIFNVSSAWGGVTAARMLSQPPRGVEDRYAAHRPLIGIM